LLVVPFLGFAGSGKTSLTWSFSRFLLKEGYKVKILNLDPGVERLPYEPDFDVRSFFTISKIMKEEGVGPNSAMILAGEKLYSLFDVIVSKIRESDCDFVLVDTPGQLEIFAFRETGSVFIRKLRDVARVCGVFLLGCDVASSIARLVVALLVGFAVQLDLGVETVMVLHKSDMEEAGKIKEVLHSKERLKEALLKEEGVSVDVALAALDVLDRIRPAIRIIATSSVTLEGHDELFEILHEIFCTCGDNL